MPHRIGRDLAALAIAVALLAIVTVLHDSVGSQSTSVPSTYDTGSAGYAALYALLGREHVAVQRFETPLSQIFALHGTLAVAGDGAVDRLAYDKPELRALDDWIRAGGRLIVLGSLAADGLGLPQPASVRAASASAACGIATRSLGVRVSGHFSAGWARGCNAKRAALLVSGKHAVAVAFVHGRGTIVWIPSAEVFDDEHLAGSGNAAFAYAIFSGGGPVAFEERIYGHAIGNSFWSVLPAAVRLAIVLACAGVLLAILGQNLPFAPPYELQTSGGRDSSEYIASLAQMLERGGARRDVIQRLCRFVLTAVSPLEHGDEAAREIGLQARALQELYEPSPEDVAAAGRIFARVRKEYGI